MDCKGIRVWSIWHLSSLDLGSTRLLVQRLPAALSTVVKCPGCDTNHSRAYSGKV